MKLEFVQSSWGGHVFLWKTLDVVRVVDLVNVVRVPGSREWFLGHCVVGSRALPVVCPVTLRGQKPGRDVANDVLGLWLRRGELELIVPCKRALTLLTDRSQVEVADAEDLARWREMMQRREPAVDRSS
ncbi:MAG: hypothetical protein AAFP04_15390 [Myxococcota bacterium]